MAHEKVYGICENKCRVEVPTKADTYNKGEIDNMIGSKADANHNHDDRYYTEGEIRAMLNNKANNSHVHDDRYYTETEIKNTLNDHIKIWEYTDAAVHKIAAKSYGNVSVDASWSNHTILGIVGVQALGCIASFGLVGNKANVIFYNPTDAEITVQNVKITVLYAKNV